MAVDEAAAGRGRRRRPRHAAVLPVERTDALARLLPTLRRPPAARRQPRLRGRPSPKRRRRDPARPRADVQPGPPGRFVIRSECGTALHNCPRSDRRCPIAARRHPLCRVDLPLRADDYQTKHVPRALPLFSTPSPRRRCPYLQRLQRSRNPKPGKSSGALGAPPRGNLAARQPVDQTITGRGNYPGLSDLAATNVPVDQLSALFPGRLAIALNAAFRSVPFPENLQPAAEKLAQTNYKSSAWTHRR